MALNSSNHNSFPLPEVTALVRTLRAWLCEYFLSLFFLHPGPLSSSPSKQVSKGNSTGLAYNASRPVILWMKESNISTQPSIWQDCDTSTVSNITPTGQTLNSYQESV